ncbi:MAG TPA: DUF697 domain-containing protein [Vicinamibacterales bacterium]|nr:DUF697 domain-containing protein [Vicinamibacterales bacterium]
MTKTSSDEIGTAEQTRHDAALHIVRRYVVASAAVGIIPIPGVDVAILAGIHIALVKSMTEHYGETFSDHAARNIVLAVGASLLPASIGSVATRRAMKLLPPGVGAVAGFATAGFASYALGRVMMAHFENGGTLDSFDAKDLGKLMWWRQKNVQALAPVTAG